MSACSSDPLPLSPGSDYASERFPPHDPPPRHLPLTQLLMSTVRLRRATFLKRLKISSCKKFVRSESEYIFHAFKGECFSTPEMLWGVRMALFVRWRGFPVNLFLFLTKHQLVGIFWWIVGRRLLCTRYWSSRILEDLLGTGINYYCADYFHFRGVWEVNNSVTVSPIPSTPKRANIV